MGSESKLQATGIDRISALPDPVLCHILSFLPTIHAVETTVLSKRWNNLWTSVPNLEFDDEDVCEFGRFATHIDSVLFARDCSDIHKFYLHLCCADDFSRIDGWIGIALRRNVVELDLFVENAADQIYELPKSLFLSKTLKVLSLSSNFITNIPASGCFPSLKSLRLYMKHPHETSMEKLVSSCPVLEHLLISGFSGHHCFYTPDMDPEPEVVLNFNISAPELKKLRIFWRTIGDYECTFFIAAPKLEDFVLDKDVQTHCFLEKANSLVKAYIILANHYGNGGHRFTIHETALLAGIANTKYLCLLPKDLERCCLPVFDNLRKLELLLHFCYHWELTKEMLKRSRNLEYLVLKFSAPICVKSSERQWNPPDHVPPCLLSHLKTISIMGFQGKLDEMEAAKYFLKNGKVMKKMSIQTRNLPCTKEEFHKELMFQRASKACQVEII